MNTPMPTEQGPMEAAADPVAPACVMSFNATDPSGATGLAGDVATFCAMGAHPLPVVTAVVLRDTAEVFEQHALEADVVAEQARVILEDITVAGWKVGFLGCAESVSAVAEILSDYPELPLVAYLPPLAWLEEAQAQPYLDAFRQLILPAAEVLVGSHKTLTDFLLPDWENERPPSARELAVAAAEHGAAHVLVTGIVLNSRDQKQYFDNVLASPQGALCGEKFELFEAGFVGAGETLSAALAAALATGAELQAAVAESLTFLDQTLDSGFRPGMGNVVPDRFFWALPPPPEGELEGEAGEEPAEDMPAQKGNPRRVH